MNEPTTQDHYLRQRNSKGRFVQTVIGGWKTKQPQYQKEYIRTHPWAKYWQWSKGRSKRLQREHTLTVDECRILWNRDNAVALMRASLDRIDPRKGYTFDNCRFIELSLNISLGNKGRRNIMVCPSCGWRNQSLL